MSLVDRIEGLAKQKGLTFKSLEREAGLGNGTIKRWERQSPRLDGLMKVANYLQVTLDELVTDEGRVSATLCDGVPLSQVESDLLAMFRLLKEHDRKNAFDFVTMLYEQTTGEKGSVYSTYIADAYKQTSGPATDEEARSVIT